MTIPAYPLTWPAGWKRTPAGGRDRSRFRKASRARAGGGWDNQRQLTIAEAVDRVRLELDRMGISSDDLVISTNLQLRLDGFPRSNQSEPADPGVAVYWADRYDRTQPPKCMAIDRYDRVADNLAAVAATLDAMRAIERHGGATILERAFSGFTALEAPAGRHWSDILGVAKNARRVEIEAAWKRLRGQLHPDRPGGDAEAFDEAAKAYEAACQAVST